MSIKKNTLEQLLPLSLTSTPAVSIRQENQVWVATAMLVHYLESFTDSLVVTNENEEPIGVIGGYEIIRNIFENPTSTLFDGKTVRELTDPELLQITPKTNYQELLEKWKKTRRAFCILQNQYGGYSAISARKILEVAAKCKTNEKISDLPQKNLATFTSNTTVGHIINLMMENKSRKIIHSDLKHFISDRIIIQTIARDLNYLRQNENILNMEVEEIFQLEKIKEIKEDLTISELAKIMFGMMHPYVLHKEQVYTPWDVCLGLLTENIMIDTNLKS